MNQMKEQFFELLKSGLWGTPCNLALFDGQTDWETIYRQAVQQAVTGLVFDGMQTLPKDKRPPRMLYLKWCGALDRIEEANRKLNMALGEIYAMYRSYGVEPVLLKGQGIAQCYRNPLRRQCGDIDLYVGPAFYETANRILRKERVTEMEENYKHASFWWKGVEVENHRMLVSFADPRSVLALKCEVACMEPLPYPTLPIGEALVSVLPSAFNAAYLLAHLLIHFLDAGIGLRHVCDWACQLRSLSGPEERAEAARLLKAFGLEKTARLFGLILVEQLGLPPDCLPIPPRESDRKGAERVFDAVWSGGNFGRHAPERRERPQGYWRGKWYTFTGSVGRCVKWGYIAPREAFFHPWLMIGYTFRLQWKRLLDR